MTAGETVRWMLTSRYFAVGTASAAAAVASAIVTRRYLEKSLDAKYQELASQEIQEAKLFYRQKTKEGEFSDPAVLAAKYDDAEGPLLDAEEETEDYERQSSMVKEAAKIVENQNYTHYNKPSENAKPAEPEIIEVTASVQKNIWDNRQGTEVLDPIVESEKASRGMPYIVPEDEFLTNALNWEVRSMVWFEQDEILCDENEEALREHEDNALIDLDNLRFGAGSEDRNVVYIANPSLQQYIEVTRSSGAYTVEVLGEEFIPPQHPRARRV